MRSTNFYSKKAVQAFRDPIGRDTRVLISITTPLANDYSKSCAPAVLHDDTWKDILRLEFNDVDPAHISKDETRYRLFNTNDAIEILKFLKKHQADTVDVIVHCEAGISRSAAVAKFIAHVYNLDFPEHYSIYNKHVFSTLLRVHGESLYGEGPLPAEDLPGVTKGASQ